MGNKFSKPVRHNVRKQGEKPRQYGTIQASEGNSMITREKLIHHAETLRERHDNLDKEITRLFEQRVDDTKVESLKKQKLKIKDEIEKLYKRIDSIK